MPTYEYQCRACGQRLEVVQSFTDDALSTCDECGGVLRKVFGSVGIAFKGSGFYKNDSRGKSTATASSADKGSDSGSSTGDKAGDAGTTAAKDTGSDTKKNGTAPAGASPAPKADKPAKATTSSSG